MAERLRPSPTHRTNGWYSTCGLHLAVCPGEGRNSTVGQPLYVRPAAVSKQIAPNANTRPKTDNSELRTHHGCGGVRCRSHSCAHHHYRAHLHSLSAQKTCYRPAGGI